MAPYSPECSSNSSNDTGVLPTPDAAPTPPTTPTDTSLPTAGNEPTVKVELGELGIYFIFIYLFFFIEHDINQTYKKKHISHPDFPNT